MSDASASLTKGKKKSSLFKSSCFFISIPLGETKSSFPGGSVTHWRIGPAGSESVLLSSLQQPSQPPPSSPPSGRSLSAAPLSVYWFLVHTPQSVRGSAEQLVSLWARLLQYVQILLCNQFICQWNCEFPAATQKHPPSDFDYLSCDDVLTKQGVFWFIPLFWNFFHPTANKGNSFLYLLLPVTKAQTLVEHIVPTCANGTANVRHLVLQITAVFVWLPDLFLQLFAPLILTGQPFGQQLIPLSGFG